MDSRLAKLFAPVPSRSAAVPAAAMSAAPVASQMRAASSSNQLQQVFARLAQPQKLVNSL